MLRKVTFLGTGTSQGIPVIACSCEVCQSNSVRDKRLRVSVLLEFTEGNYVIDAGPDFRQQMLREDVEHLDGILLTHEHKDHIAGLDDVRSYNFLQQKPMPIFCDSAVEKALHREFFYAFGENRYPGVPSYDVHIIDKHTPFQLPNKCLVQPIEVMHYKLPVLGFRIDNFTYITDAKTIADEEMEKIRGTEYLVINALHRQEHLSHFNLHEAIEFIQEIKPKHAYLTHVSHMMGKHDEVEKELPDGICLAYDGLEIHPNSPRFRE